MIFLKEYMESWITSTIQPSGVVFRAVPEIPFCQKSKDYLFPKNAPTDDISSIPEKDDIHPKRDDIGI